MKATKLLAPFAAASLVIGLAACSSDDAKEAADSAGSVAAEATDAAGSAADKAGDAADKAGDAAASATSEAADSLSGDDETQEVTTADGQTVQLPKAVAEAAEQDENAGELQNVQEGPNGEVLAAYEGGQYYVYSKDTGAQPVRGAIGESWINDGGFDNPVGLPTEPESPAPEGHGYVQKFTNGTITWTEGDGGEYETDVEVND